MTTAGNAADEAQKTIKTEQQKSDVAVRTALATTNLLFDSSSLCVGGTDCANVARDIRSKTATAAGNVGTIHTVESLGALDSLLNDQRRLPKPTKQALEAATVVKDAREKAKATNDAIARTVTQLDETLKSTLSKSAPDLLKLVEPGIQKAASASPEDASKAVSDAITQIKTFQAAAEGQAAAVAEWPAFSIEGTNSLISVEEDSVRVPDGDDNRLAYLITTNSTAGVDESGKVLGHRFWPDNTMTIHISHGRYYWDAGVLFAGVYRGTADFSTSTSTTSTAISSTASSSPTSYSWAFQPMIAGTVYPGGRDKFVPTSWRCLIPGIQIGVNADLSKIANAVSLGVVEEPVTGLAFSLGGMFFARGNAPAASNGTQSTEHVFLPYIGVSLNAEFYNSIKAVASSSGSKS